MARMMRYFRRNVRLKSESLLMDAFQAEVEPCRREESRYFIVWSLTAASSCGILYNTICLNFAIVCQTINEEIKDYLIHMYKSECSYLI